MTYLNRWNPRPFYGGVDVNCDGGTQTRVSEFNQLTVDDYCDRMNGGEWDFEREPLPYFIYDGQNYYPVTGHHRTLAAQKARLHICARIKHGTLEDAIYEAVRDNSNANHGLPESSRDRRHRINAFFQMFETWTDDKRQQELEKIDCYPVGKTKQKFNSWSSRSIACYLRIPASYKQVQDVQSEREQTKKYQLVFEVLQIGKWYQWHNGEQICVGKLTSKSEIAFEFDHPYDRICEWSNSLSLFLQSVKEVSESENIPFDYGESELEHEHEPTPEPIPELTTAPDYPDYPDYKELEKPFFNPDLYKVPTTEPTPELNPKKISHSLKMKCYQLSVLDDYSEFDISELCQVLGDWAKLNGHDGFAKGIINFSQVLLAKSTR